MTDRNTQPTDTGPGPTIVNHGTVHTASQGGDGYVAAMGDRATGHMYLNGKPGADSELRELVAKLRRLFDDTDAELANREHVDHAITDLEEKVDDNVAPERLRAAAKLVLFLTEPATAFVDLLTKIQGLIDKLRH